MDYNTVIRCYIEMAREGSLAVDASEILVEEIIVSTELSDDERTGLLLAVGEWQVASKPEKYQLMATIQKILNTNDHFQNECVKFATYRLTGGKTEGF